MKEPRKRICDNCKIEVRGFASDHKKDFRMSHTMVMLLGTWDGEDNGTNIGIRVL